MERLTKRDSRGIPEIKGISESQRLCPKDRVLILDGVDRLAAYEDAMTLERAQELAQAEKDGRLVVLPCKVGDNVFVRMDDGAPYIARVQGISVSATGKDTILKFGGYPAISVWGSGLGKTWFRFQREAEEALKKEAASTPKGEKP